MAAAAGLGDIDPILHPVYLEQLKAEVPVKIRIWQGGVAWEAMEYTPYPFDTLDTVKYHILQHYRGNERYLPKNLFIGVPAGDAALDATEAPSSELSYYPFDYTWYPPPVAGIKSVPLRLTNPIRGVKRGVAGFREAEGAVSANSQTPRGRSTIEDVFLIPRKGVMPVLHVFVLQDLLAASGLASPMSVADWNRRFLPFFPTLGPEDTAITAEDRAFGKLVLTYLAARERSLGHMDRGLEAAELALPAMDVTGIRQLRLVLRKPEDGWDGCESLFYKTRVTAARPYLRLLPSEGAPVSKIFVKGVLPIPALDDPEVLLQWAKEISPTAGKDFVYLKYVHRKAIGITCPIYGTVRIFDDGSADLLLLPPKRERRLDPTDDFRNFGTIVRDALQGLPQNPAAFELGEIALTMRMSFDLSSRKFDKKRLAKRLPFFSSVFQEITPLPGQGTLLSLRYKAVSQYATEDKVFAFLTQAVTKMTLDGEEAFLNRLVPMLEENFQLTRGQARDVVRKYYAEKDTFTVVVPEEGEFIENNNPGIDIHILSQHPLYTFQCNRIDSYQTFQRIVTLLSMLFMEDDDFFNVSAKAAARLAELESSVDSSERAVDRRAGGAGAGAAADLEDEEVGSRSTSAGFDATMLEGIRDAGDEGESSSSLDEPRGAGAGAAAAARATVANSSSSSSASSVENARDVVVNPNMWFLNKLKAADVSLFGYQGVKGVHKPYSTQCQAGDQDRQPAVLSKEKYARLKEIYADDIEAGRLFIHEYPLTKETAAADKEVPRGAEELHVMRYGSKLSNVNYYFCSKYYCLRDELIVLERDFVSDRDRKGRPKPKNTCPFCRGTLITDRKGPVKGATVVRRVNKKGSKEPHRYVGFLKSRDNPGRFALPCCHFKSYKAPPSIYDEEFALFREIVAKDRLKDVLPEEDSDEEGSDEETDEDTSSSNVTSSSSTEEGEEEAASEPGLAIRGAPDYAHRLQVLYKPSTYILGAEKLHLPPGKFGVVPKAFDDYFLQKSSDIVQRTAIRQVIKPVGEGFVRIGVEQGALLATCGQTQTPTESLLGVLAPLLSRSSIEQVRERLLEICTPLRFINANFGNLVHEFYQPSDADPTFVRGPGTLAERGGNPRYSNLLREWASKWLGVSLNDSNAFAVNRIYKSYRRFIEFLRDKTQRKDIRHLASFLTEPGVVPELGHGLQLVVLEWDQQTERGEEAKPLRVRCIPYGFSSRRHKENDFAFVWRDSLGYYQLLVHTKNAKETLRETHETTIRFLHENREQWPTIVRRRVDEYMSKCQSTYRGLYTSQRGVDSRALVPMDQLLGAVKTARALGVVRDSYNHVAAVLFAARAGVVTEETPMVAVPIADDGWSPDERLQKMALDWEDFTPAPVDQLLRFWQRNVEPALALFPGYQIRAIEQGRATGQVVAVQLKNGVHVPAGPPTAGVAVESLGVPVAIVEELDWTINRELAMPPVAGTDAFPGQDMTARKLDELYQYFRMTVANWLTSREVSDELRKRLEDTLFDDLLPEYEKRKRLEILFGRTFAAWMHPDEAEWELPASFLRKDCRLIESEEGCSGACVWRGEGVAGESKCKLHVDAEAQIRSGEPQEVSTVLLFVRRVLDELIRFPQRRKQLMKTGVPKLSSVLEPVRQGDQYILPEGSTTWLNLLRMDWMKKEREKPQFYEEMRREGAAGEEVRAATGRGGLPPSVEAVLGDASSRYQVWYPRIQVTMREEPLRALQRAIGEISLEDLRQPPTERYFTKDAILNYVLKTKRATGVIDARGAGDARVTIQRTANGPQDRVLLFVYTPDQVGLLLEEEGVADVAAASLPPAVRAVWDGADRVFVGKVIAPKRTLRKAPVAAAGPEALPTAAAERPTAGEGPIRIPTAEELAAVEARMKERGEGAGAGAGRSEPAAAAPKPAPKPVVVAQPVAAPVAAPEPAAEPVAVAAEAPARPPAPVRPPAGAVVIPKGPVGTASERLLGAKINLGIPSRISEGEEINSSTTSPSEETNESSNLSSIETSPSSSPAAAPQPVVATAAPKPPPTVSQVAAATQPAAVFTAAPKPSAATLQPTAAAVSAAVAAPKPSTVVTSQAPKKPSALSLLGVKEAPSSSEEEESEANESSSSFAAAAPRSRIAALLQQQTSNSSSNEEDDSPKPTPVARVSAAAQQKKPAAAAASTAGSSLAARIKAAAAAASNSDSD